MCRGGSTQAGGVGTRSWRLDEMEKTSRESGYTSAGSNFKGRGKKGRRGRLKRNLHSYGGGGRDNDLFVRSSRRFPLGDGDLRLEIESIFLADQRI